MKLSVVVSTYNQPEWLLKVLHGYLHQSHSEFELVIADDGSGERTRELIEEFRPLARFPILHVWQEDEGFRKSRILNLATVAAAGDYLIFTDGDCIPRRDYIATHVRHARPGIFLSGGYFKLPMDLSTAITRDDIASGAAFDAAWLRKRGMAPFSGTLKLSPSPVIAGLADAITPRKATWNGCNSSTWKADILAVNGHNEEMAYGGEDREMGERLFNRGSTSRQIRHQAVLLHLDHSRSYMTEEVILANLAIRKQVVSSGQTWSPNGIEKRPAP